MTYFQILDNKLNCWSIYTDGQIHNNLIDIDLKGQLYTWNYYPDYKPIAEFAQLYVNGKDVESCAPNEYLKQNWINLKQKKKAFIKSFQKAKVNLNDYCFYDLVPESFLIQYNYYKTEITKHVIENIDKPLNYDFLCNMSELLHSIKHQRLNISKKDMMLYKVKTKKTASDHVDYNLFGTITGRLSTKSNSFPILTLDKKYRSILKPNNHYFVEFDLNAADIRTFIGLLNKDQPEIDIHEWNIENIFKEDLTRKQSKSRFFSWFYDPTKVDKQLGLYYDRDTLLNEFWDGKEIINSFGRKIEADQYHALSYLIQSTSNDLVLDRAYEVFKHLKDKKTNIAFMIHDSIVLDLHEDDIEMVKSIKDIISNTQLGHFPKTTVSVGSDFGSMKRLNEQ